MSKKNGEEVNPNLRKNYGMSDLKSFEIRLGIFVGKY